MTLDEKEARIVLALIQAAGHAGLVNGDNWRETAAGFLALEAKVKEALASTPVAVRVPTKKDEVPE